jgi:hypothetical protein
MEARCGTRGHPSRWRFAPAQDEDEDEDEAGRCVLLPRRAVGTYTRGKAFLVMRKVRMKLRKKEFGKPLAIALAVAAMGIATFLIVEFGPSARQQRNLEGTKAVAESAGAKVIPSPTKSPLDPVPPGPKPIDPTTLN